MASSELLAKINSLVGSGAKGVIEAKPYLKAWLDRFGDVKDPAIVSTLEQAYYFLAIAEFTQYSLDSNASSLQKAAEYFSQIIAKFPNGKHLFAAYMGEGKAYVGLGEFKKAFNVYRRFLAASQNKQWPISKVNLIHEKLVEAVYLGQLWEEGAPYLEKLLTNEYVSVKIKSLAAIGLLESFIDKKKLDKIDLLIPFLKTESIPRYEVRLNIKLMIAGDLLNDKKDYSKAMFLYRSVFTLGNIRKYLNKRLIEYQGQLKYYNDIIEIRGVKQGELVERVIEIQLNIDNLKAKIEGLKQVKPYAKALKERIARTYKVPERDWEAFWAYLDLIERYPKDPSAEDFAYYAFTSAAAVDLVSHSIDLGERYLANPTWKRHRPDIVVYLCRLYLEAERYPDAIRIGNAFIGARPNHKNAEAVLSFLAQAYEKTEDFSGMAQAFGGHLKEHPKSIIAEPLNYWTGYSLGRIGDFEEAIPYLTVIIEKYKGGDYSEDSLYQRGLAYSGIEAFEKAREDLTEFVQLHPKSERRGGAEYFLGTVNESLGNSQEALGHYTAVRKYAKNYHFIKNSYFSSGNLLRALGKHEELIANYQEYLKKYKDKPEAPQAVYQIGQAYQALGKPIEMLKLYREAIVQYGDNPQAYAIDPILRDYGSYYDLHAQRIQTTLQFLNKVAGDSKFRKAIAKNRNKLFEYLAKNRQVEESVKRRFYDKTFRASLPKDLSPVKDMLKEYNRLQASYPKDTPTQWYTQLRGQAVADGKTTLAGRLQWALAERSQKSSKTEGAVTKNPKDEAPSTLIWIGHQRLNQKDLRGSRKAFQAVLDHHPKSKEAFEAVLGLGDVEVAITDYPAAFSFYRQAQVAYPLHNRFSEAVIREANALVWLEKYDQARGRYKEVYADRSNDNALRAKALFQAGVSYYRQSKFNEAVAYFERVYIGYAGEAEWVIKAYQYAGKSFERQGLIKEARRVYNDCLSNPRYKNLPQIKIIQKAKNALP